MKYIGKKVNYSASNGEIRSGIIKSVEFHEGIGKWLFSCVSPFGNTFRLTKSEFELSRK